MPNPKDYKDKQEFMSDCMHQTRRKEKMPQDQAVAVCLNMWRDKGKKTAVSKVLRHIGESILER